MFTLNKIPPRGYIVYAHDVFMAALSFGLSMYLRLGDELWNRDPMVLVKGTALFIVGAAVVFRFMGLYKGVWRYASMNDLMAITRAATVAVLLVFLGLFLWTRLEELPRSVPFINWFVLMALLGGPRFIYRIAKDRRLDLHLDRPGHRRIPVLLVGAGDGAELFIRHMNRDEDADYKVVGILAETAGRVGRNIHGVEVLGTTGDLKQVVDGFEKWGARPERLILTKDDMDGDKVASLLDVADALGMTLARLPRLTDFKDGKASGSEIRPVAIEDLLGRPQTPLDRGAMAALIKGKRVLITGAGGSIGSELVRQAAGFGPAEIVLLDSGEFNLYAIDLELSESHPELPRKAVIADVRNRTSIDLVWQSNRPQIVLHAAALKHVPLVEANPFEGLMTNAVGTAIVAEACVRHGIETMVQVSTDKAVNPANVMGSSKRIAEQYCQSLDLEPGISTNFVTVRFGNVLASAGSVVPLFQKQLAAGGPITVTHPDMTRYFMTIREAVELILQAAALNAKSTEADGKIFVLEMGKPVKIVDLAHQLIRLAGLKVGRDIEIKFIGLRPGEKLYEEVFHAHEKLVETGASGILLAAPRSAELPRLRNAVAEIETAWAKGDKATLDRIIRELVPEYTGDAESAA